MPTPTRPLPTIEKTWQFANNLDAGLNGSNAKDNYGIFILIKNALQAFGSNAWTVVGSSDGTTGALDAVDRLTDYTKFVNAGGNHSWIVLQQAGINANTQVCFDFNTGNVFYMNIWWSPAAGFTGGAVNARPTATDEQQPWNGNAIQFFNGWNDTGAGQSMRAHVMQSTDGQCTRIFLAQNHQIRTFLLFDRPGQPVTGWNNPAIAIMTVANSVPMNHGSWYNTLINGLGPIGAMPMYAAMFYENVFSETINDTWPMYSEWDHIFQMNGIGMFSNSAGQRGRHGYIFDMWTLPAIAQTGYSIPLSGSKEFIVMGQFAFPWDGGDIEMA